MKIFKSKPRDDDRDGIEGERSVTSVNRGLGMQTKITNVVAVVGLGALVIFLLYEYYAGLNQNREAGKTPQASTKAIVTSVPPLKPLPDPPPAPAAPPPPAMAALQNQPGAPVASGQRPLTVEEITLQRRLKSGVFFKSASSSGGASPAAPGGHGMAGNVAADGENGGAGALDPLSQSLKTSRQAGAKAYLLADPSLMVTKGSIIPCSVVPALNSSLPGIVTCIQSADVWSADGKVILLERGTKWVGEQKAGLQQGQQRLGILWTRGETPQHVLIDVDSGTADSLGRPGIDGTIDTHFWQRFGGAILISLVSDVGSFLAATQTGGNSGATAIAFPGTITGAQSAVSEVLRSTINIPPTLMKSQGGQISIFVARDLDFRDVYGLESRR